MSEFQLKFKRLKEYLKSKSLDAILLGKQYNFAWATGGKDNHVVKASEDGACWLLFTTSNVYLIASNIEMPRLEAEEVSKLKMEKVSFPWYQKNLLKLVQELGIDDKKTRSDTPGLGFELLPDGFNRLRYQFVLEETDRYQKLGKEATRIVENACLKIEPGQTESEAASKVEVELAKVGIRPSVLLVGSDRRAFNFRHPIPKNKRIKNYVMVVVCARREGQVVNLTRCIYFSKAPKVLANRFEACAYVDARMISASIPGMKVAEILKEGIKAYQEVGYPNEWKKHHQGGATGYREREYLATLESDEIVLENQPFAWNPSIKGAKSEDTIIAKEEDFYFITQPGADWPTIMVNVEGKEILRPNLLIR